MRLSVYAIYVFACFLACGAAILSGVVLVNTFNQQQRDSEATQLKAGMGQVTAFQTIINNQMKRMRTASDNNARSLFLQTASMPDKDFAPEVVISAVNETMFLTWVPSVKAVDQLNGYGLTFAYPNATTGAVYDRTFQVYWDLQTSGTYEYAYAVTSLADGLCHAWRTVWKNYSVPLLTQDMYAFNAFDVMVNTYKNDDFFDFAIPWSASDGNSYWIFTHMRAFFQWGLWVNVQTWDAGVSWLDMMKSVLTEDASFVAFDSQGYVMAATNADEVQRLASCRGSYVESAQPSNCINITADQYPVQEIRDVYAALYDPAWDDLSAAPITPKMTRLALNGKPHMAISGTLFSEDNFRTIIVWYQPWVVLEGDSVTLTALICLLTVLSTFVLTLMGIFGVLRPLMVLGGAMRAVAETLKDGSGEAEAVLEPRKPNVFREVDEIGKDFETIVVDFLGFSHTNARDNRYAPKDTDKPFAVVFTDIQSSTGLWGVDPAEMSRCVQSHHELIRDLVREYRLYEVKTVGDSFMVTTSSAQDALLFALSIQMTLFNYNWGWDGADAFYRETTLAFTKAMQGPAAGADYCDLWNGLRVRVGIHYGEGEVTYDEVSKGYDYYGTVVNTAARIESIAHGGQVVVSRDVIEALPTPLDPLMGTMKPLGVFPLRGVSEPPALVEVKPTRLQNRLYPPLRLEVAEGVESNGEPVLVDVASPRPVPGLDLQGSQESPKALRRSQSSVFSHASRLSAHQAAEDLARTHSGVRNGALPLELVTHQMLVLYRVVEDLLRPLAPQQHATVAKALAKGWGVPVPKGRADFGGTVMRLVFRLSETTKVFAYLGQRLAGDYLSPRYDSDVLEAEVV